MPGSETIWILEDDAGMQFAYQQLLSSRYQTVVLGSLAELSDACGVNDRRPRLLIADVSLPDGSFVDMLRTKQLNGLPTLVVSSMDDMAVLKGCFDNGASDFLTKPFSANELAYKIERLIAQSEPQVTLDLRTFSVTVEGRGSATLTGKEYQILSVLHEAKQQVASRGELLAKVWGEPVLETKALDVHIYNLRRKIGPLGLRITYRRPVDYILELDEEEHS